MVSQAPALAGVGGAAAEPTHLDWRDSFDDDWGFMRIKTLAVAAALLATFLPASGARGETATTKTYYFHTPTQANVDQAARGGGGVAGPFMDEDAPTKQQPSVAAAWLGDGNVDSGTFQPVWVGALTGTITGEAKVEFWAHSQAVERVVVSLYADGAKSPFADSVVAVSPSAEPVRYEALFTDLRHAVATSVTVQLNPGNATVSNATGRRVGRTPASFLFDAVPYPSSFTFVTEPFAEDPIPVLPYVSFDAPGEFDSSSNETSIGVNPETGSVMFQLSLGTARVTFDHSTTPPTAKWEDVSSVWTSQNTLDPQLHVDRATGRTFVSQLQGAGSITAFTDDDGENWTLTTPPHALPSWDHQSTASGPYAGTAPVNSTYGRATYYCAQGALLAQCARSDDGGLTWGAPVPFNAADCNGLHGRPVVGPNGFVYVPVKDCSGDGVGGGVIGFGPGPQQGLYVSEDNGETWRRSITPIPAGESDPAVAVDAANRVYFFGTHEGQALISTSDDGGKTMAQPYDVAASHGLKNVQFASAVAGDAGRAAVSFYGTPDPGDDQSIDYTGEWHVYVATTVDGGQSWETVDITPHDPVQRGMVCLSGVSCTSGRNLLDFQSMTIDAEGRVLVGYADGCITRACRKAVGKNNRDARSTNSLGVIAVQLSGPRLILPGT